VFSDHNPPAHAAIDPPSSRVPNRRAAGAVPVDQRALRSRRARHRPRRRRSAAAFPPKGAARANVQ
jgi:hypothetical protein